MLRPETMIATSLISARSPTPSVGSRYSSPDGANEFDYGTDATSTQPCSPLHLSFYLSRTRSEDRQALLDVSATQHNSSITNTDPGEEHRSSSATSTGDTTNRHSKTQDDAGRPPRCNTAGARQLSYNPDHKDTMNKPTTYRQMFVDNGTFSQSEQPEASGANANMRDIVDHRLPPGLPKSPKSISSDKNVEIHPFDVSLASISSEEPGEDPNRDASSLRSASQQPTSFAHEPDVSTSQLRRALLSNISSALEIEELESSTSDRKIHREAALQALDGACESSEQPENVVAGPSSHVNRRHGRVDWHKSTLFSSKGRQYSLGDHNEGYLSGRYITCIKQEDKKPEKNCGIEVWKLFFGLQVKK
ncbi:hypothetical protein HRS9122_04902 [Pyrenophora teres f. teres]|nr:hypothetical protein HRS9122_04902 [Pyrenophora teres f. teres]